MTGALSAFRAESAKALFAAFALASATCVRGAGEMDPMTWGDSRLDRFHFVPYYAQLYHFLEIMGGGYGKAWPLRSLPAAMHNLMCWQQYIVQSNGNPVADSPELAAMELPGCASPEIRAEAATNFPSLKIRNAAVEQLEPFFNAGGTFTNQYGVVIDPLMACDKYVLERGLPWPSERATALDSGDRQPIDFSPTDFYRFRVGHGRGGCFATRDYFEAGLYGQCNGDSECTAGHEWNVAGRHPAESTCHYLYRTLDPYFEVDWDAAHIPTPGRTEYPSSWFVPHSAGYISADYDPWVSSNRVFRSEPWLRSWGALGTLNSFMWHLCDERQGCVFTNRTESGSYVANAASSNAVKAAVAGWMASWHPDIGNGDAFGAGAVTRMCDNKTDVDMREHCFIPGTASVMPYAVFYPYTTGDIDISFSSVTQSVEEVAAYAPTNSSTVKADVWLSAVSSKKWRFVKTDEQGGGQTELARYTSMTNFGYGEHEYEYRLAVTAPYSYDWALDNEGSPVATVDFHAASNAFAEVSVSTNFVHPDSQFSFVVGPGTSGMASYSSVCEYQGGVSASDHSATNCRWFVGEYAFVSPSECRAALRGAFVPPLGPFWADDYDYYYADEGWDETWDEVGGETHWMFEYTVSTTGKPQPYSSDKYVTNRIWTASYADDSGVAWSDLIVVDEAGQVLKKIHALAAEYTPDMEGGGFSPYADPSVKHGYASSRIDYSVQRRKSVRRSVKWTPLRVWGWKSDLQYY